MQCRPFVTILRHRAATSEEEGGDSNSPGYGANYQRGFDAVNGSIDEQSVINLDTVGGQD